MRFAVALANRMALTARAVATKKEFRRVPASVARRGNRDRGGVGGAGKPEERAGTNGRRVFERVEASRTRPAFLHAGPRRTECRNLSPDT